MTTSLEVRIRRLETAWVPEEEMVELLGCVLPETEMREIIQACQGRSIGPCKDPRPLPEQKL
jgi:hypothetical protein